MTRKTKILIALVSVFAILELALIITLFAKRKMPDTIQMQRVIEAKDELIKAKDQYIQLQRQYQDERDSRIAALEKVDSLLVVQITNNKKSYETNDKKLQAVGPAVADLDKEQLRREIANF